TFSKWAGLAGLRVGYGIFPEWIISHLLKIKQPYNVNVAGSAAAVASLSDVRHLQENIRKIVEERERLYSALRHFDFLEPYPSEANFILSRVVGRGAAGLKAALAERGILIRYFNTPRLQDHVRISVGKPSQTSVLLDALKVVGSQ
ncbi:MAG: aminotransferase class I/II-fold pyridoxal phosphate-dependent enzyme, partial [Candidatus Poribacteria bacterium]|nr:aminotransferase class I/II-fold pyridoxal phosphate-dependent enzyme [Candidatus Poribacteria bacterium]